MDDETYGKGQQAILKSDEPVPSLRICKSDLDVATDSRLGQDSLFVQSVLTGRTGSAKLELYIDRDDLNNLIGQIEGLLGGQRSDLHWTALDHRIELEMRVESDHIGPPVFCRAVLSEPFPDFGDKIWSEKYECAFYSHLSWVGSFLGVLQGF